MAEFKTEPTPGSSNPQPGGKWKAGGRGRPPKNPPGSTLPGNSREINGNSSSIKQPLTEEIDNPDNYPETYGDDTPPTAALPGKVSPGEFTGDPRAHPDTYPRRASGTPIPPHRVIKTELDFTRYMDAMTPDDWGHCEMYVYKKRPMDLPTRPNYIDKIGAGPFDLDKFIRTNGSGLYHFGLNDANITVDNRRSIMYAQLELEREDYPEKYNLDTLDVQHKNNVRLVAQLKRDGIIDDKGNQTVNTTDATTATTVQQLTGALIDFAKDRNRGNGDGGNNASALQTAMMTETVKMMANASKTTLEAALAQIKGNDPATFMSLIAQMKDLFQPAQVKQDDGMLKMLLDELRASRAGEADARKEAAAERQRQHELQLAAMNTKATAADPLAQFEQLLKIKSLITGGAESMAGPRNWKEMAVGMLGDNLPQVLTLGTAIFQSIGKPNAVTGAQAIGAVTGADTQPQQFQPQQPQAQPHPQQVPIDTTNPRPGQVHDTATPEERAAIARIQQLQGQLQQYGQFLINAITSGQDGYKFAESMITMAGELTYARAAAFTVPEWMTAIFSFPIMAQTFAGVEAKVEQFVTEFLDYDTNDDDATDTQDADGELERVTANPPPSPAPTLVKPKPKARTATAATAKGTQD